MVEDVRPEPADSENDKAPGRRQSAADRKVGALAAAEALLEELLAHAQLPAPDIVNRLRERLAEERTRFDTEESPIAREVALVAAGADRIKKDFDIREMSTRSERAIGILSPRLMLRRQRRRIAQHTNPARFVDIVEQGHSLRGRLSARRAMLATKRTLLEKGIADLAGRRTAFVAALMQSDAAMAAHEAILRVEQVFFLLENAVRLVNRRIRDVDLMGHKVVFEVEELLVYYRAAEDVSGLTQPLPASRYPHIGAALQRLADGRLVAVSAAARKPHVDAEFSARFTPPPEIVATPAPRGSRQWIREARGWLMASMPVLRRS